MRPVLFYRRYRYKDLHPDNVATIRDLALHTKFFAVWRQHPDDGQITILRKTFSRHVDAAIYADLFQHRYVRLRSAQAVANAMAAATAQWNALPWWKRLILRLKARRG